MASAEPPPKPVSATLPKVLLPSLKVTLPVGSLKPVVVTVAVNVTSEPKACGLLEELT